MLKKFNCWEHKDCGRQPGGYRVHEFGECPVTHEERLDGVHGGKNAGRACWIVAGSMCKGEKQGTFAQKYKDCRECDFYKKVQKEEGPGFEMSVELMKRLSDTVKC